MRNLSQKLINMKIGDKVICIKNYTQPNKIREYKRGEIFYILGLLPSGRVVLSKTLSNNWDDYYGSFRKSPKFENYFIVIP